MAKLYESFTNFQRILTLKSNAFKILPADVGAYVVPGEVCSWCETLYETFLILPQKGLEKRLTTQGEFDSRPVRPMRKSCLVDSGRETGESYIPREEGCRAPSVFGCFKEELGATLNQEYVSGTWSVKEQRKYINKLELRAIFYAMQKLENIVREENNFSVLRQHDSSLLHKETGRHKLVGVVYPLDEEKSTTLMPRFIKGKSNIVAGTLSRKVPIVPTE